MTQLNGTKSSEQSSSLSPSHSSFNLTLESHPAASQRWAPEFTTDQILLLVQRMRSPHTSNCRPPPDTRVSAALSELTVERSVKIIYFTLSFSALKSSFPPDPPSLSPYLETGRGLARWKETHWVTPWLVPSTLTVFIKWRNCKNDVLSNNAAAGKASPLAWGTN